MKALLVMIACAAAGVFLWAHWPGTDYTALANARDRQAQNARAEIVVAALRDARGSDYVNGIELAVHQINCEEPAPPHAKVAGCEPLLGRRVALRIEQAADDPEQDMKLVDRIVRDDRVIAVLGHRSSRVALPASLVYEAARVIFMSPFATRKSLTGHDFQYVLRMAPSSPVMAEQLASVAASLGYEQVAILHARDDYSRELAFLFEDAALTRRLRISRRSSFLASDEDYRGLISELRAKPFDAVFVSAPSKVAGRLARQLRELGVTVPIIGTDIDPQEYREAAGSAGGRTILPVLYQASQTGWRSQAFVKAFQALHDGRVPDANAAQGYDSMLLLASAIRSANTTRTAALASALHFMPFWIGVTGLHAFDHRGELLGKHYQFQWLHDDAWSALPGLQRRFQLERAEADALRLGEPLAASGATLQGDSPPEQIQRLQFDLARHMLRWDQLGIILAADDSDTPEDVEQALAPLTDLTGTPASPCLVHPGTLDADLVRCLQQLSADSQALMLARFDRLGPIDSQALETRLRHVELPVFALSSLDNTLMPPGLSLYIDVAQKQPDFALGERLVGQLAPRQAATLARLRLANLPVLQADMQALQELGVQKNPVLLDLYAQEMPPAPPRTRRAERAARTAAAAASAAAASATAAAGSAPASEPASATTASPASSPAAAAMPGVSPAASTSASEPLPRTSPANR